MARVKIELDSGGILEVLQSAAVRAAITPLAQSVAAQVRAQRRADVVVDSYTTDRAAASVTIRDGRALGWQARDGILTRAAGAIGLSVRSRR